MKVDDIAKKLEKLFPPELAEGYDNVGLLLGDADKDVKTILVTLDTNLAVAKEAVKVGADMIVSHHPILFNGIKRIDYSTPVGKMLKLLIENDIAVFAAHTNLDAAKGGINDALAKLFEMKDTEVLEPNAENSKAGLGRYGRLKKSVTLAELAAITKEKLNTPCVRMSGRPDTVIETLAIASGSCSEVIPTAMKKGCQAIITGDMKYHETIENVEAGICIIDAGHYPTETISMDIFESVLKSPKLKIMRSKYRDIFRFV